MKLNEFCRYSFPYGVLSMFGCLLGAQLPVLSCLVYELSPTPSVCLCVCLPFDRYAVALPSQVCSLLDLWAIGTQCLGANPFGDLWYLASWNRLPGLARFLCAGAKKQVFYSVHSRRPPNKFGETTNSVFAEVAESPRIFDSEVAQDFRSEVAHNLWLLPSSSCRPNFGIIFCLDFNKVYYTTPVWLSSLLCPGLSRIVSVSGSLKDCLCVWVS